MANFNTHLNGGFIVSGITGLIVYKAGLVDAQSFVLCVLIGTIGGLLPDIDSDNSTPIKLGFNLISLGLAFALTIHWRTSLSLITMLILWTSTYLIMRYGIFYIFTRLTVHRGIIHSVPYMMAMALALVCINYYILKTGVVISWFYGAFLLLGSLIHLGLDEAYSVDLLNQRLKRSSGTAMKFYKHNQRFYYFGLYAILGLLIVLAPPFSAFWQQLTDPVTWWLLKDSLLPEVLTRY